MNVLQKSIEAFIAAQGKTAAAGLKLRHDLQKIYLPENGVAAILRDIYGENATRRTHETEYNAIHYAWMTIGDDGKRKPSKPRQPKNNGKNNSKNSNKGKDGTELAQPVKLPISELAAWIRSVYSLAEMRALKEEL